MAAEAQRRKDEEAAARRCAPLLYSAHALLPALLGHAASPLGAARALSGWCMRLRLLSGMHSEACHVCR